MTAPDTTLQLSLTTLYLSSIRGKTIKILSILPLITEAQGPGRDGAMLMLIGDKEDALLCSILCIMGPFVALPTISCTRGTLSWGR